MVMNFLDLFAGIGGFALGAQWAGLRFDNHFFSEIDPFCCEIYGKHYPEAHALGSITELNGRQLVEKYGSDWIITGGFPCQSVSTIGKRKGFADHQKSGLWHHYARVIGEIRPRFVVIENVKGLLSLGFDQVLSDLYKLGYDAEWKTVRACDVGLPHNRQRIWIVAYPQSNGCGTNPEQHQAERNMGTGSKPDRSIDRMVLQALRQTEEATGTSCGEPIVYRANDGLSPELHATYRKRVRALGNSIVPQIAAEIFGRLTI